MFPRSRPSVMSASTLPCCLPREETPRAGADALFFFPLDFLSPARGFAARRFVRALHAGRLWTRGRRTNFFARLVAFFFFFLFLFFFFAIRIKNRPKKSSPRAGRICIVLHYKSYRLPRAFLSKRPEVRPARPDGAFYTSSCNCAIRCVNNFVDFVRISISASLAVFSAFLRAAVARTSSLASSSLRIVCNKTFASRARFPLLP